MTTQSLLPGSFLAEKYRVERVLGQGGMGIVVLATHLQLQQQVAIKVLLPEMARDAKVVARFLQEGRSQVRIQGEHVVRVLDVGTQADGAPFMVMELLTGSDLGAVAEARGALPVHEALDYVLQATEALAQAHSLGIVHRDLKPGNMFLTTRPDGSPLVKVLDFGISKNELVPNATRRAKATTEGGLLGSPAYMSPEQIRNPKDATPRSDIWSLGVILYELLTGYMPFNATSLAGILAAITRDAPDDIRRYRPDLPESVAAVVMRCLSRAEDDRPRDVAELALALALDAPGLERANRVAQIVRRFSMKPAGFEQTVLAATQLAGGATIASPEPTMHAGAASAAVGAMHPMTAMRASAIMMAHGTTFEGASNSLPVDLPMSRIVSRKWMAVAVGMVAVVGAIFATNVAIARAGHRAVGSVSANANANASASASANASANDAAAVSATARPIASSPRAKGHLGHGVPVAKREATPAPEVSVKPAAPAAPAADRDVLDTRK